MYGTEEIKNAACDRKSRCSALVGEVSDILINTAENLVCALKKKCAKRKLDATYLAIGRKYFDEISGSPGAEYRPLVDAVNAAKGEMETLEAECGKN